MELPQPMEECILSNHAARPAIRPKEATAPQTITITITIEVKEVERTKENNKQSSVIVADVVFSQDCKGFICLERLYIMMTGKVFR